MRVRQHWFDGPAGRLDARIHGPPEGRPLLLLHPHPQHGGTMGTRLIYRLAEDLAEDGWQTVRFGYRGVGRSEGAYDEGRGEADDAVAVWDALHESTGRPPVVVGFSFGAGIAIALAGQRDMPGTVLIAPPAHPRAAHMDNVAAAAKVGCPARVIIGTDDELVPPADADAVRAALPDATIKVLQGADHFLTPTHHDRAIEAVRQALDGLGLRP